MFERQDVHTMYIHVYKFAEVYIHWHGMYMFMIYKLEHVHTMSVSCCHIA
jgi:hypothetical protein